MITKRQLGIALMVIGASFALAIISTDWLGAGNYDGIGPMQRLGLAGTGIIFLIGLSLLPLGNRPA